MSGMQWRVVCGVAGCAGVLVGTVFAADIASAPGGAAANYAAFRGADGSGSCGTARPPVEWSEKATKNIRWKTPIPLQGWASPVVWGDTVFVAGANKEKRAIYGVDVVTGKVRWTFDVPKDDRADNAYTPKTTDDRWDALCYAGATPVTDGKKVVALFSNGQLAAATCDGKAAWTVFVCGPGTENKYGLMSSLRIHKNSIIVSMEGDKRFVAAYSLENGKELWKADRKGVTWASPLLAMVGGRAVVIVASDPEVMMLDAETGKAVWSHNHISGGVAYAYGPSPVMAGDVLVLTGEKCGIVGVNPASPEKPVWTLKKTENVDKFSDGPSVVAAGDRVYHYYESALICLDAKTGKVLKEKEMDEMASYASPVLANGRLYLFTSNGGALVCDADPAAALAVVGKGSIEESCDSSPAVAGDCIFLRGDTSLYCIGSK